MNIKKLSKTQIRKLANKIKTLLFHPAYQRYSKHNWGIEHNEMIARVCSLNYEQLKQVLIIHYRNQCRSELSVNWNTKSSDLDSE